MNIKDFDANKKYFINNHNSRICGNVVTIKSFSSDYRHANVVTQINGEPNEDCIKAVAQALECSQYDSDMVYFRSGKYHSYGTEYMQIGNMFFNVEGE